VAILEANVKRVVARIFALTTPNDTQLWAGAEMLLNTKHPFDHNQAMMDLGSMICTPKAPNCHACPANIICRGRANPEVYPTPKVKKKAPTRWIDIAVRMDKAGRLYLEKRSDALLGGLYGFPQSPSSSGLSRGSMDARTKCGHDEIGKVVHIYSHFRLEGRVMLQQATPSPRALGWYTREEIRALPLSKVDHKVLELVDARHSAAPKAQKPRPSRKHR
jgi:A/G-specific adenine glycosylase